ncbi:MAG: hypothetical protein ABEJ64_00075 [Candidatus Nanohaloarchaea archaeon]
MDTEEELETMEEIAPGSELTWKDVEDLAREINSSAAERLSRRR